MSSSTDLEQIKSRIVELVKDFVTPHADDAVASSCKDVADAVARVADAGFLPRIRRRCR